MRLDFRREFASTLRTRVPLRWCSQSRVWMAIALRRIRAVLDGQGRQLFFVPGTLLSARSLLPQHIQHTHTEGQRRIFTGFYAILDRNSLCGAICWVGFQYKPLSTTRVEGEHAQCISAFPSQTLGREADEEKLSRRAATVIKAPKLHHHKDPVYSTSEACGDGGKYPFHVQDPSSSRVQRKHPLNITTPYHTTPWSSHPTINLLISGNDRVLSHISLGKINRWAETEILGNTHTETPLRLKRNVFPTRHPLVRFLCRY